MQKSEGILHINTSMHMKVSIRFLTAFSGLSLALALAPSLHAGPFILAGTDADDHGFFGSGANQDGWFFMQRALENLAPGVTNGNKQVVFLGSNPGTQAGNAALSAFTNSTLPGLGWTAIFVNDAAVGTFLSGGLAGAGIIMMDSSDNNVSGGANASERGAFTANAGNINSFLGGGGGLFSQANGYGWVSALLPTLTVNPLQSTGLFLTPAGNSAFPGLNNGDLSSGPYHNYFTNTGALPILAVNSAQQAVILGAAGGTVTNPQGVPDSGSFAVIYIALAGMMLGFRRHLTKRVA